MKLNSKIFLFFIFSFLLVFSSHTKAQKQDQTHHFSDNIFISGQYDKGFLLAHRGALNTLANAYTQSINLEIGTSTFGKQEWHKDYNYPSLGIGYFRGNLGNQEVFGMANALYGFYDSPFFKEQTFALNFKFAFGLAYLSKKFDINENIYNVAIGSNFNYYVQLSLDLKLNLLQHRLFVKTGPSLSHMSNGKTQTPNLGLNLVGWHISSGYYIGSRNKNIKKANIQNKNRQKNIFIIVASGGFKEGLEPNLEKYFAGNLTFDYEYAFFKKCHFGLGLDYFYDGVIKQDLIQLKDNEADLHANRMGIHAAYSIHYNKISFIVQMGSYIAPFYTEYGLLYHRVGFRAKLTKHLLANLSMKTFWGKAEIVEFGFGYYFMK